jgi:hypothetical protein
MKRLSIIFILFLLSKISYGQFYAEGNMLAVNSDFEIIKPTCNFIVGAKLDVREKAVEVIWKTKNDTVSGYYMIYKSRDFNNLELVDRIFVPKGVSISVINSIEDVKPDDSYNFYHILKVKEKENINLKNINIKDIALVNLPYRPNNISIKPINRPFSYLISNQ